MWIRKTHIILITILITAIPALSDSGRTGLSFLSLGQEARGVGMGEAQTGLAEGVGAVYWNPAGLALVRHPEAYWTQLEFLEESTLQSGALALPLKNGKLGSFGFSYTQFSIGEIASRDVTSALLGQVEQKDRNLQLSYGLKLTGRSKGSKRHGLLFGMGVKKINEQLAGVEAGTTAFDVGLQYRPGHVAARRMGVWIRRVVLGVSALNLGKGVTFDQEETDLPQRTSFGLGYTHFIRGDALSFAVDYHIPRAATGFFSAGAEFWALNILALRVGYLDDQDVGEGLRAGAGFRFRKIQFDYAWAGFGSDFGDTHRFGLSLRFGAGADDFRDGVKADLVNYYLSAAHEELSGGAYHLAILHANEVLKMSSRNSNALQILFEAGEKLHPKSPLPEPDKKDGSP